MFSVVFCIAVEVATEAEGSVDGPGVGGAASDGVWGAALGPLERAFCFLLFLDGPTCSDEA